MHSFKEQLIDGYYAATWPWRARYRQVRARVGLAPVMALFYHRVADQHLTDWTISNDGFRRHLDWLEANVEVVTLAEAQRRIALRYNPRPCVAITFDDGYGENCDQAIGQLIQRKMPATYFVTLDNVLTGKPFPHDAKLGIDARPNTVEELREMAASGVIEIGAHSRTHPDVGAIRETEKLQDEVIAATEELSALIDQPIRYFAFPFGQHANLNDAAIEMLRGHGIHGFCSAYGGYNLPGDDPYHIQRIHGDPELSRLRNWLTIDPRKVNGVSRYQPCYAKQPMALGGEA